MLWFAHVPGLRVVMPLLAARCPRLADREHLCDDPVVYIDDRWLYGLEEQETPLAEHDLREIGPRVVRRGTDVTLVGASYSTPPLPAGRGSARRERRVR